MVQYNPNPNCFSNKTGYVVDDSPGLTLTSTADGLRVQKPNDGNFAFFHGPVYQSGSTNVYMPGMSVRKNNASSWGINSVFISQSSTSNGLFLSIPDSLTSTSTTGGSGRWVKLDRSANFKTVQQYSRLWFRVDQGAVDITIKGMHIYDSGSLPAATQIDSNDVGLTFGITSNSRTFTIDHDQLNDEAVARLTVWRNYSTVIYDQHLFGSVNRVFPQGTSTVDTPGTYAIQAIGTMPQSEFTYQRNYTITVPSGVFTADFTHESDYLGLSVDASSSVAPANDPITSYVWEWGDGTSNTTTTNPIAYHTYTNPGIYNVTLTTKTPDNGTGTNTKRTSSKTRSVAVVSPPSAELDFAALKDLLTVAFAPSKTDGTAYAWDFGDGADSVAVSPVHVYDTPGTYTVTLTVDALDPVTHDVTVTDTYTPIGSLLESLRLEVGQYKSGTRNLIENPSGATGAWAWSSDRAGSYITGSSTGDEPADKGIQGPKLIYRSSGSGDQYFSSSVSRATAGQYCQGQINCPFVEGYVRVRLAAFNAAGAVIGTSSFSGYQSADSAAVIRTPTWQLPANTVGAQITMIHTSDTGSGVPTSGKLLIWRRSALFTAATSGELTNIPYSEGIQWVDVLGPTHEISITREALDLGTLSATILDSAFDPAVSGMIRPGQPCRLRVLTPAPDGSSLWEPIFTGSVGDPEVEYVPHKGVGEPGPKLTRIKLTAYDAVRELGKWKRSEGVAAINQLPVILEGVPVPYEINGSTGQVPSASIVNANDNASVLDQVAITRDTDGGYAYVSRGGVLKAWESEQLPTTPVGVIDETVYAGIRAGFNLKDTINSVRYKWLEYFAASGDDDAKVEPVDLGPYEDAGSIDEWGLRPATFTVIGNPTGLEAKAGQILAANATPARTITEVDIPIRYEEDLSPSKALIDLYDLVQLGYERTETDEQIRVTAISHKITPKSWLMTLGFSVDGAVASPQVVAAPPISVTTPQLPFGSRSGSSTQSIPDTTYTLVTFLTVDEGLQGGVTWSSNRFTVPKAGVYMVTGRLVWAANAATNTLRIMDLRKNDVRIAGITVAGEGVSHGMAGSVPVQCAAGDTISLWAYQNVGSAINIINYAGNTGLSVLYLGA